MRTLILAAGTMFAATALTTAALAEWKPKGPIKMMIAFRTGGGVDTQARLIAEAIQKANGWKIIPQQVAGKGGAVMARKLKGEPKDGLTIRMLVSETLGYNMMVIKKPGFKASDFAYLTTTAASQMGIVAKKSKGWKTFKDVIAAAKKGAKFKAGAMSQKLADGSYLLGKANGVKFNTVHFKGGKGVLNAITAGDVDFGWVAGPQARGVRSGDLVNLASGETSKLKISPNAPLVKDLGVNFDFGAKFMFVNLASGETSKLKISPNAPLVKDLGVNFDFGAKFMFVAPAGIPADARKALTDAIIAVLKDNNSKAHKFITRAFGGPSILSGKELEKFINAGGAASKKLMAASAG